MSRRRLRIGDTAQVMERALMGRHTPTGQTIRIPRGVTGTIVGYWADLHASALEPRMLCLRVDFDGDQADIPVDRDPAGMVQVVSTRRRRRGGRSWRGTTAGAWATATVFVASLLVWGSDPTDNPPNMQIDHGIAHVHEGVGG